MESIKEKLQSQLSTDHYVKLDTVKGIFDVKDQWIVEIHLATMIDQGIVSAKGVGQDMAFLLKQSKREVVTLKQKDAPVQNAYAIAATLPETILPMAREIIQTRRAMRDLLASAVNEVLVSQPFIDNTFVEIYEDEIRSLAKRGTKLVLVSRKVSTDTTNIKGILKIFEIYSIQGNKSKFEVYEHWIPLRIDHQRSKQFVGLHAKLVLGEGAAYLGSANWTGFSLSNNVEIGLLIKDEQMLAQLKDLFSLVKTQSTKIDVEKIHRRLIYKGNDHYARKSYTH